MSYIYSAFSSLWSSFWQSLGLDGLFSGSRGGKQGRLLLLGLDNAGKTTLLHRLATGGDIRPYPPTDRPRTDSFRYNNVTFQAWDLGGHEAVRHLWEDYVGADVSAVLFLVDAVDRDRFEEAGYELDALLGMGREGGGGGAGSSAQPHHRSNGSTKVALASATADDRDPAGALGDDDENDGADPGDDHWDGSPLSRVPVAILINKCDLLEEAATTDDILAKLDFGHLCSLHPPHLLQVFRISVLTGDGYPDAFKWVASFL
jgi:GTPase SAR1 family protein